MTRSLSSVECMTIQITWTSVVQAVFRVDGKSIASGAKSRY